MLPMHYHARAANFVVAVKGNTTTYMWAENGARLVTEDLGPGQATIFPRASVHMMVNTGAFSALSSPGFLYEMSFGPAVLPPLRREGARRASCLGEEVLVRARVGWCHSSRPGQK